jgi:hypothetical protein
MPQSQLEQHQPLKSSASTQIKRLFIRLPLYTGVGIGTRGRRVDFRKESTREVSSCPLPHIISHGMSKQKSNYRASPNWAMNI